jgi:tetratricopeptide (TPR) repeat protein
MTDLNKQKNNSNIVPRPNDGASDLSNHPDYVKLVEYFQSGKFNDCMQCINELEEQYPEHPDLIKFKDNIELKLSMKSVTRSIHRMETRDKIRGFLKYAYLIVLIAIFSLLIAYLSYDYINSHFITELTQDEKMQLSILETQVERYLNEGEPEAAAERLERMREINPRYSNIPDLASRVYNLLLLKKDYESAKGLLAEGSEAEALDMFINIEQEHPGLWDVSEQIMLLQASPTP